MILMKVLMLTKCLNTPSKCPSLTDVYHDETKIFRLPSKNGNINATIFVFLIFISVYNLSLISVIVTFKKLLVKVN